MINQRNILIVFPHNFFERKSGVHKRYYEFVSYLKGQGFTIDLFGLRHFESDWDGFLKDNASGIINQLYLYDFRRGYHKNLLLTWGRNLFARLLRKQRDKASLLPDYAFPDMVSQFRRILETRKYDYVVVGYVYWANLLKGKLPPGIVTVLTMEDFIAQNLWGNNQSKYHFQTLVEDEVERVNLFDKVICLSHEEMQFFSTRALQPRYFYIPVFMEAPVPLENQKEYDLVFIGSDNPDNIEGIQWFFQQVLPLLDSRLKILVVGKIVSHTPGLPNVTRIAFADDLREVYSKSRISVNPLQKGTGMKVKVVESLAHGIPVVNTKTGLCGIPPAILDQFIMADGAKQFAESITRLLNDAQWYNMQCLNAGTVFKNYFDIAASRHELNRVFPADEESVKTTMDRQ